MAKLRIPKQYLGAFKAGHRASAREYIDERLASKLLRKDDPTSVMLLEWITKFNNEYYKGVLPKDDSMLFHSTPKYKKDINDRMNARRRDIMIVAREFLVSYEDHIAELESEDEALILEYLDDKYRY